MKTLSERLKFFIQAHSPFKSIREFEREIGWKNGSVNQLTNNSSVERFTEIENILNINIEWLLSGKGEMLKSKVDNYTRIDKHDHVSEPQTKYESNIVVGSNDDYMMAQYADLSAVAGELGFENPATLPKNKRRLVPKEYESGNYLVIGVEGDSMDDGTSSSIPNGAEILVREYSLSKGEKLPVRNTLYVIVSADGSVFKQVIEHNLEDNYIVCHSFNSKYKDFKIPTAEIIQIFVYRKIINYRPLIPDINS